MADNAGLQPAFMDFQALGSRYTRLIEQFRTGGHVHAYLFAGPQGIGKRTFALTLASILYCEEAHKPCGVCPQCRLAAEGKHSSITEITPENGKAISVDRIRELISAVSMHTLDGNTRTVIIEPMESLTPQAQNCLLKSLEEPGTNIVYFLLSHDASSLLDTIVSRCSVCKLTPWPSQRLEEYLLGLHYPRIAVERAVALSGGNIGEALTALQEQPGGSQEEMLQQLLNVSTSRDAVRCSAELKGMASSADQILFRLERYLQQCMLVKAELLPADILSDTPWGGMIGTASMQDFTGMAEQIVKTRKYKMSNVNWQSNMDQLAFRLLEAKHKWQKS